MGIVLAWGPAEGKAARPDLREPVLWGDRNGLYYCRRVSPPRGMGGRMLGVDLEGPCAPGLHGRSQNSHVPAGLGRVAQAASRVCAL